MSTYYASAWCGLVLSCAVTVGAEPEKQQHVPWLNRWDAAVAAARPADKPILLYFHTKTCAPCKVLEAKTFPDRQFRRFAEGVVLLKQDADVEGKATAKRYEVRGYPTMLLLEPDGTVMGRVIGFRDAGPLVAALKEIIAACKRMPEIDAALTKAPDDPQLNMEYARLLFVRGDSAAGLKQIERLDALGIREAAMVPLYLRSVQAAYETGSWSDPAGMAKRIVHLASKADALATEPGHQADAKLALAEAYMMLGEVGKARRYAEAITKMADASAEQRSAAEKMVEKLKGRGN